MTMCYGSCYLKDQLQKEAEKKSSEKNLMTEQIQLDKNPEMLSVKNFNTIIPTQKFPDSFVTNYQFIFEFDITHPPCWFS